MKKLFLMGFVALGLASCVSDKEVAPQTQGQKYAAAFENFVGGKVNPNVNWGFNDQTPLQFDADGKLIGGVRGNNANGNEWGGYVEVPEPLTTAQKEVVRDWFQTHRYVKGIAVNWSDFFVQQVYKGGDHPTADCPEKYEAEDGNLYTGSNQMDKLTCGTNNEHIDNFNNGFGTEKSPVLYGYRPGNEDKNLRKVEGKDNINFMVNSSTECFGYYNSASSQQRNDKFVIIPGDWIDPSVAGMWFVGLDFEGKLKSESGANLNQAITADGYYSDWIVRITPGLYKDADRVFAEDLIDSSLEKVDVSDWDFNDAVFDVRFVSESKWDASRGNYEEKYAIITLWAAGGTKDLTVAGKEVHELFGKSTGTMINTNANGGVDGLAPVIFRVETDATNAINIPVKVNRTIELEAKTGEATQKMAVAYGTKWMKERYIITGSYTEFQKYVRNSSPANWYETVTNEGDLYTSNISVWKYKN